MPFLCCLSSTATATSCAIAADATASACVAAAVAAVQLYHDNHGCNYDCHNHCHGDDSSDHDDSIDDDKVPLFTAEFVVAGAAPQEVFNAIAAKQQEAGWNPNLKKVNITGFTRGARGVHEETPWNWLQGSGFQGLA
ncbi:hypothetical protein AK812_SmicGene43801 [Symbiodinium microadriaticum]|uniref:Uncharacterized protein n=1 Tax=Symbiodinium microadriaticum TaxID=2951 RepID=A0A1Q9C033_SYMMI|nr:hypothetical protein AK812_SmicGene43801 [Symbiodinium microadriaticum]